MSEGNQISFTVNNINTTKKNHVVDGMIALKKIQHFSYALSDQIGLGYSSHVYKGKNDKTNQIVAIKVIDIKKQDDLHKQFTNDQINILQKIKNASAQYLLKLQGVFKTKNNLYIITEFCQGKDVAKILRQKKFFSQQQAQGIMKQFLKGYAQLYKLRIVHRDLKLANIFVRKGKAILADFGFAIDFDRCKQKFDYNVGSPFYMPPQSLKFNRYSYKSDVWAIGVIAYELIYGKRPWKDRDDDVLIEKIMNTQIDELFEPGVKVSQGYKQFIRECLRVDYDRRASPQFVINFEWSQANEYVDGHLDPSNPQRGVSMNKMIPNIQPTSAKNVTYKPIQFEELKQRKFSQNGENMYSLMQRQPSPHRENLQLKKKNVSDHVMEYNNDQVLRGRNQKINGLDNAININKEFVDESDTERMILSQIHYCRFLNNIFDEVHSSSLNNIKQLLPQIGIKILDKIDFLSRLDTDQENQLIPGFRKYVTNLRWRKLSQMIGDYKNKYFSKFSNIVNPRNVQLSLDNLRNCILWLKNRISEHEKLLELLTYLYQVSELEYQKSALQFAKESRIEYLANNKYMFQNGQSTERLLRKLNYLGF